MFAKMYGIRSLSSIRMDGMGRISAVNWSVAFDGMTGCLNRYCAKLQRKSGEAGRRTTATVRRYERTDRMIGSAAASCAYHFVCKAAKHRFGDEPDDYGCCSARLIVRLSFTSDAYTAAKRRLVHRYNYTELRNIRDCCDGMVEKDSTV